MGGNAIIDIRLVYYLRDQLRPFIDQRRIGRWQVGGVDGIGGSVFDQKSEEGEDGADEKEDDDAIDDEEDDEAASHYEE